MSPEPAKRKRSSGPRSPAMASPATHSGACADDPFGALKKVAPLADGLEFCPERGVSHPKLRALAPHDAVVMDVPLDSIEYRTAFIRMVRELDFSASLTRPKIDREAITWFGGKEGIKHCYDAEERQWVPALGLAGGHTLPELLEGCKLKGAEGLVALRPNPDHPGWYQPIAYLNYWTDVEAPEHMRGLMDLVRSEVKPGEKFAIADTVVCLPEAPKGMYRALLGLATVEFYEKAFKKGISKVFDIVRLEPNPNPAIGAHETLGWKGVKTDESVDLELFEAVVSEALGFTVPGRFQVVCFDLTAPGIGEQLRLARELLASKRILTLDLDGCSETFEPVVGGEVKKPRE